MNLEERILILAPTVFFLITVAWGYIFEQLIFNEIREVDSQHYRKIKKLLSPHLRQVTYSDGIFLFMINGILWVLQLYRLGLGVIFMVAGVVVAVTGLLSTFMWRHDHGQRISNWALVATLSFALVELVVFVFIP